MSNTSSAIQHTLTGQKQGRTLKLADDLNSSALNSSAKHIQSSQLLKSQALLISTSSLGSRKMSETKVNQMKAIEEELQAYQKMKQEITTQRTTQENEPFRERPDKQSAGTEWEESRKYNILQGRKELHQKFKMQKEAVTTYLSGGKVDQRIIKRYKEVTQPSPIQKAHHLPKDGNPSKSLFCFTQPHPNNNNNSSNIINNNSISSNNNNSIVQNHNNQIAQNRPSNKVRPASSMNRMSYNQNISNIKNNNSSVTITSEQKGTRALNSQRQSVQAKQSGQSPKINRLNIDIPETPGSIGMYLPLGEGQCAQEGTPHTGKFLFQTQKQFLQAQKQLNTDPSKRPKSALLSLLNSADNLRIGKKAKKEDPIKLKMKEYLEQFLKGEQQYFNILASTQQSGQANFQKSLDLTQKYYYDQIDHTEFHFNQVNDLKTSKRFHILRPELLQKQAQTPYLFRDSEILQHSSHESPSHEENNKSPQTHSRQEHQRRQSKSPKKQFEELIPGPEVYSEQLSQQRIGLEGLLQNLSKTKNNFEKIKEVPEISNELLKYVKINDIKSVRDMIEYAPQLLNEAVDHIGQTALHWAAKRGYKKLAEMMINKGANMMATDLNGKTPLDTAIAYDQVKTISLLKREQAFLKADSHNNHISTLGSQTPGSQLHKPIQQDEYFEENS